MTGRILIIDSVATHRIVLKVKMQAAQYAVDACANQAAAARAMALNPPDLILMNMSSQTEDHTAWVKALRRTQTAAIIAIGVADTSQARFAALDAGADDVMPHPLNDALLLARIRSLLRVRSAGEELVLRDSTSRALGFEEQTADFVSAAHVAVLAGRPDQRQDIHATLASALRHPVHQLDPADVLASSPLRPARDLFVIDAASGDVQGADLFGLISDLRARSETRLAAQMVIVSADAADTAAMFLDLGADDVVPVTAGPAEISLRAKVLITRKLQNDRLRDTVRHGLHAAVTDPLTGLYNRRYVEPHLARLAEQSQASGRALAVMMIDIDHFKTINDSRGHAAGDAVLKQLADRLRENLRAIDLVARIGGEEFLVAMPRTSVRQARLAADRLRRVVNNTPFQTGAGKAPIDVTVSVGVAVSGPHPSASKSLDSICAQADAALYAAKSAGRNQVAMSRSAA